MRHGQVTWLVELMAPLWISLEGPLCHFSTACDWNGVESCGFAWYLQIWRMSRLEGVDISQVLFRNRWTTLYRLGRLGRVLPMVPNYVTSHSWSLSRLPSRGEIWKLGWLCNLHEQVQWVWHSMNRYDIFCGQLCGGNLRCPPQTTPTTRLRAGFPSALSCSSHRIKTRESKWPRRWHVPLDQPCPALLISQADKFSEWALPRTEQIQLVWFVEKDPATSYWRAKV